MRFIIFLLFICGSWYSFAENLGGSWQGVMYAAGTPLEKGNLVYLYVNGSEGDIKGLMREELYESDLYAVKQTDFSISEDKISFKQVVVSKNKKSSSVKWCRMVGELKYDPITGYLTGDYSSNDCKRVSGKIILYRSSFKLHETEENEVSQIWFSRFLKDYKDGLSAPEIRDKERKNFVFEPVYFDYDEAVIKDEYKAFLDRMIKVVKGHSDLRVSVTGHTDADGSDAYNDELSRRRAEAIVNYFVAHGLSRDRLEFDFKGERNPIDNNTTPEGKQRNRRVDFKFI